jgi:hypothetical protein
MHISMNMFRILFRPNPQLRCFPTHLVMDELPGPTLQQLFRLVLLTQGHIARLDRGPFEQCSRWRLRQRKHRSKSNTACTLSDQVNILPFLGFQNTDCLVNDFIMPMQTTLNFHLCPSLEAGNTKWCPWDEELDSNKRVHFLIAEPAFRYDPLGQAYFGIDSIGSDMAERAALIGAGAWRLAFNHAVPTVFCTASLTGSQQAFGLMGSHKEDASFQLLRGIYQALEVALGSTNLILHHVRSHAGDVFNEFADYAAKTEAKKSMNLPGSRPHCSGTNKIHTFSHYMETSIFWTVKNGWSPPVARFLPEIFR